MDLTLHQLLKEMTEAAFDDIDQIIDDSVFQSQDDIQVAKPNIGVDADNLLSGGCQRGTQICRNGGFSNTTFS